MEELGELRELVELGMVLGLKMLLNMVAERRFSLRELQGRRILRVSRRHRRLR